MMTAQTAVQRSLQPTAGCCIAELLQLSSVVFICICSMFVLVCLISILCESMPKLTSLHGQAPDFPELESGPEDFMPAAPPYHILKTPVVAYGIGLRLKSEHDPAAKCAC